MAKSDVVYSGLNNEIINGNPSITSSKVVGEGNLDVLSAARQAVTGGVKFDGDGPGERPQLTNIAKASETTAPGRS